MEDSPAEAEGAEDLEVDESLELFWFNCFVFCRYVIY